MSFLNSNENFENLSLEELNKKIQEVSAILEEATRQANAQTDSIARLDKQMIPLINQYRELQQKRAEHEKELKELKPVIRDAKNQLEQLRHWIRQAQLKWLNQQKFEEFSREIDATTIGAPWREFAMQHQIDGAKRIALVSGRALLGDKRGLGKTLTSLIACDMLKARKILVFAPKETIRNFENEIKTWAKERTLMSLIGRSKLERDFLLESLKHVDEWILTINLEAWRRDKETVLALARLQADTVIIDEAHFIKDPSSVACEGVTKIVYAANMCALCGKESLSVDTKNQRYVCTTKGCDAKYKFDDENCRSVKHVIPMTGTPILNNPKELWPLLYLIDRKSFPSENQFLRMYCVPLGTGRWQFKYGGEEELVKKLDAQFIQRDRKSAGVVIPPQSIQYHDIDFDPKKYPDQYRAYQELKEKWVIFSNENPAIQLSMPNAISAITRLRQMMVWPNGIIWRHPETNEVLFRCDVTESIKIDYAIDLIQELVLEGERVVLFSQFKSPLHELYRRLEKISVPTSTGERFIRPIVLDGDTPEHVRDRIRYDFDRRNNSFEHDIVLAHYRVGGQSLNFTAATQMILLDRAWNEGQEDQARGRIDRMGQTQETTVHILRVDNTIDTWMDDLIEQKKKIVEGFEGAAIDFAKALRDAIEGGEI